MSDQPIDVRAHVRRAPIVPDTTDALDVLETLRDAEVPMALIHDEYGHFEGIVTPADVLEAIAGVFRSDAELEEPHAVSRDDGSWLLSGAMPADEMAEQLGIALPAKRDYHTVAGLRAGRAAPSPLHRRARGGARLALRDRRPGRPAHRQGAGDPPRRRQPAAAGLTSGQ